MDISVETATLFSFDSFYKELHIDEGVEDVLAGLQSRFSALQTLTEGYKIYLRNHKGFLVSKLSNAVPKCQVKFATFFKELEDLVKEMKEEKDIILLCEKKDHLDERIKAWKANSCVEDGILSDTALVKKKNCEMLRRIHPHTQEFCLRLMSAAEEMRECECSFERAMEDHVSAAKAKLEQMAVQQFRVARVEKLKGLCKKLREEANEQYARKMAGYKEKSQKFQESQEDLYLKQSEKIRLITELQDLPAKHTKKLDQLKERNEGLKLKLGKLEAKAAEIDNRNRMAAKVWGEEKRKLMVERSRLQSLLAKEKGYLCQAVKHCEVHGVDIFLQEQNICAD